MIVKQKIKQSFSVWGLAYYFSVEILFIYFFSQCFPGKIYSVFAGLLFFLIIVIIQQRIHRASFRAGMRHLKKNEYNIAVKCFKKNLKYFERHPFLDRYRHLLLISPSAISCKEMALKNIVACYYFLKDKEKTSFYYESLIHINKDWTVQMPLIDRFLNSKLS